MGVHKQQLLKTLDMCVYIVYAYFKYMHVCIWCTCQQPGIGNEQSKLRTGNPIIIQNSGSDS